MLADGYDEGKTGFPRISEGAHTQGIRKRRLTTERKRDNINKGKESQINRQSQVPCCGESLNNTARYVSKDFINLEPHANCS
jgi:hypothetical protein